MKKSIILFAIALGIFATVGCNKEDVNLIDNIKGATVHFTINTNAPETKSYFLYDSGSKQYTPGWHKGDALGVMFDSWSDNDPLDATFTNTAESGLIATFSGTGTVDANEKTIYAFYPASQLAKAYDSKEIGITIPSTQKPTATSFDKNADILVNKPYPITIDNESVVIDDMQFTRVLSVLKLVIVDGTTGGTLSSDKIKSVTLTTKTSDDKDGEPLTGRYQWDFANETGKMNGTVKSNKVSANLKANPIAFSEGASGPIYLMVNPTTLPQNSKLVVDIATDKHDISKTATLSAKAFEFPAGNVAKLSVTILDSDACEDAPVEPTGNGWFLVQDTDWLKAGDKIVITNVTPDKSFGTQGTNNWSLAGVSVTDGKLNVGSAAQFTLAAGSQDETFALKIGDNYLNSYTDDDSKNWLKSDATSVTDASSWYITATKTSTTIFNVALSAREIQYNSGNSIFSTYKSTQNPVRIYKQYTQPELAAIDITVTPDHSNKKITVTWDDVEHATNYAVACTGQDTQNIAAGVETAEFTGLSYGTEYTITVTASAAGYVSSSDSDVVTLVNPAAKTITKLKASITGVAAAGVTNASESGVYSLTNATDGDLTVTPDGTVVTAASASSGSVTYTVANNTGAARNGSITIEVSGGNSIEITVSQLAGSLVSNLTFTEACGGSGTADDGATWTVTSDAAESTFTADGIHYGTNNATVQYVQLSTSDISGTITKVVVTTRDAQACATVSVTVGGEALTCSGSTTATNTSTGYTFTGSETGEIIVRVDRGSAKKKAIYVLSVEVTYTPSN